MYWSAYVPSSSSPQPVCLLRAEPPDPRDAPCAMVPGAVLRNGTSTRRRDHILHGSPRQPALPLPVRLTPSSPLVNRKPSVKRRAEAGLRFPLRSPPGCFSHQSVTCFALDDKIPWNRILLSQSWILLPSIWWLKLGDTWPGALTSRRPLNTSWALRSPCSVHNVP